MAMTKCLSLLVKNTKDRTFMLFKSKKCLLFVANYLSDLQCKNILILGTEINHYHKLYSQSIIDSLLKKRLDMMAEFLVIANSINVTNLPEYTCDRALNVYQYCLIPKWNKYLESSNQKFKQQMHFHSLSTSRETTSHYSVQIMK